jgi:hypothetical protein
MAVNLSGHSFKNFVALYAEDFYALQHLTTRKVLHFSFVGQNIVIPIHTMKTHKGVVQV